MLAWLLSNLESVSHIRALYIRTYLHTRLNVNMHKRTRTWSQNTHVQYTNWSFHVPSIPTLQNPWNLNDQLIVLNWNRWIVIFIIRQNCCGERKREYPPFLDQKPKQRTTHISRESDRQRNRQRESDRQPDTHTDRDTKSQGRYQYFSNMTFPHLDHKRIIRIVK